MKVELDPGHVANRVFDWLGTELMTTFHGGVNHELDDYRETRLSYLRPTSDNPNKVEPHYERFKTLMGRLTAEAHPYADRDLVATVGHHTLMQVAGAYRWDSNLKAETQELYNFLHAGKGFATIGLPDRQMTPTCIDLKEAAETGLIFAESFEAGREVEQLRRYGVAINKSIYEKFVQTQEAMIRAGAEPGSAFAPDHEVIGKMHSVQKNAMSFAAAHFAVAASLLGGQDNVPILQPDALHVVSERDPVMILAKTAPQYE